MASINALPVEVLIHIAETLDTYSLSNFAIVNSTFHQASRAICHRHFQLIDNGRDSIRDQVPQWLKTLTKFGDLRCVRSIGIVPLEQADPPACRPHDLSSQWPEKWRIDPQWNPRDSIALLNQKWVPFANLLQRIPGLRDLSWASSDPVPPCVLEVLHRHLPQCRLDVRTFFLHSLLRWPQSQIQVSPFECALATSPSLQELTLSYSQADPWGMVDYHEDAVMDLISGGAPNLRRVSLHIRAAQWGAVNQTRQAWDSERNALAGSALNCGMLTSLEICSEENAGNLLRRISTKTDFARLRTLKLYAPCEPEDVLWLAEKCRFPSLRSLALGTLKDAHERAAEGLGQDAVIDLLRAVPPLECLCVPIALNTAIVRTALERHGRNLRELSFYTLPRQVQWQESVQGTLDLIRTNCSVLVALAIPVPHVADLTARSTFYTTLGLLGPVQHMVLSADPNAFRFSSIRDPASVESIFHDIYKAQREAIPALSTLEIRTCDSTLPGRCRRVSPPSGLLLLEFQQVDWRRCHLQASVHARRNSLSQPSIEGEIPPRSFSIWRKSADW